MKVTDFVKDSSNIAQFLRYREGNLYYMVKNSEGKLFEFTIPLEDTKGATFPAQIKAITLMRWIRLGLETGTLQPFEG